MEKLHLFLAFLGLLGFLLVAHLKLGFRTRWSSYGNTEKQTKTKHTNKLRVLSQNTWCIYAPYPAGGPNPMERLQLLVDRIKKDNCDIVCLQELTLFALGPLVISGNWDFFTKKMNELGLIYHNNPSNLLPWFGMNHGLMIYSRYALKEITNGVFDQLSNAYYQKGYIHCVIEINNDPNLKLYIINTHFEHKLKQIKMSQLSQVGNALQKCEHLDAWQMALGDFNICSKGTWEKHVEPSDRMYGVLCKEMNKHGLSKDLVDNALRTFRQTEKDDEAVYDHIFVNSKLQTVIDNCQIIDIQNRTKGMVMSDHYGLGFEIRI